MVAMTRQPPLYSLIIALHPVQDDYHQQDDWRIGDIAIDWMDFAEGVSPSDLADGARGEGPASLNMTHPLDDPRPAADITSSQALVALHADSAPTKGSSELGPGVIHLFKHPPPEHLSTEIALDSNHSGQDEDAAEAAEGADGTLVAVLAVPGWMRPADFVDYIGSWTAHLEGVRMIRFVFLCRLPHRCTNTFSVLQRRVPQQNHCTAQVSRAQSRR